MSDFLQHVHENIKTLKTYQPGKTIAEVQRSYRLKDVVKLASNENPLGPSPKVKQALIEHLDDLSLYPEDAAPELKQALADYTGTSINNIVLGCASSELLEMVARIFLHPGENMIVNERCFGLYKTLAAAIGAEIKIIADSDFQQDLSGILEAINAETRLIMIANPNNPTGSWHPADELFNLIRQVREDIIIVIDEAYYEFMQQAEYKSAVALIEQHPNVIVMRTFSKAFALAGARFGYCICAPQITDLLERIRKPFNVANITLVAALAALQDSEHLQATLANNTQGLQQLTDFFKSMKLPILSAVGNFLTVEFGQSAGKVAQALLEKGVIVRPLLPYKMPYHLRISVGTPRENAIFMEKLREVLSMIGNYKSTASL